MNVFYYFDGNAWTGLAPVEKGSTAPIVKGDIVLDSGRVETPLLRVPGFGDNALVPRGVIVMWSGSIGRNGARIGS